MARIVANVDGRPIPSFSRVLMIVASLYRAGGLVQVFLAKIDKQLTEYNFCLIAFIYLSKLYVSFLIPCKIIKPLNFIFLKLDRKYALFGKPLS